MLVPPGGKDSSSGKDEPGAGNVVLEETAVSKGRELPFIAVTASVAVRLRLILLLRIYISIRQARINPMIPATIIPII